MPDAKTIATYDAKAGDYIKLTGTDAPDAALLAFIDLIPSGGHVLDLGCGAGDPIARWFIAEGFRVTGVDFATSMLEIARTRWPDGDWRAADMRVLDLGDTFDYYREISPEWLDYVALTKGVMPPAGAWRYLELGCGQGYGLTLLAALYPDHDFLGIDFNPVHITHARSLATAAGLKNVRFEEADFLAVAESWPADWGKFDYITAHGIYSWLSHEVCEAIVTAIDRAATPGALIYLSYNTLPAWISSYPIQHLMRLWQTTDSLESVKAIETGISRLQALTEAQAGMTKLLPGMKSMLDKVATRDRAYLVQEYLHDNWHPRWLIKWLKKSNPPS